MCPYSNAETALKAEAVAKMETVEKLVCIHAPSGGDGGARWQKSVTPCIQKKTKQTKSCRGVFDAERGSGREFAPNFSAVENGKEGRYSRSAPLLMELVTYLVGAFSPASHRGLHQG